MNMNGKRLILPPENAMFHVKQLTGRFSPAGFNYISTVIKSKQFSRYLSPDLNITAIMSPEHIAAVMPAEVAVSPPESAPISPNLSTA